MAAPFRVHFVKATPTSITLDIHVSPQFEQQAKATVETFELQWREAKPNSTWMTASSALKLRRCTKGNLQPGSAYIFRARGHLDNGITCSFGAETEVMRTTLPEVPEGCSEALKVPAMVVAAESEKASTQALRESNQLARHEATLSHFVERKAEAARAMQQACQKLAQHEKALRASFIGALEQVLTHAEKTFENGTSEISERIKLEGTRDVEAAAIKAASAISAREEADHVSWAGSAAIVEAARADARHKTHKDCLMKLEAELKRAMEEIQGDVASNLLQALRNARMTAETVGELGSIAVGGSQTMVRHTVEGASLDAVHELRLKLEESDLVKQVALSEESAIGASGLAYEANDFMLLDDDKTKKHVLELTRDLRRKLHLTLISALRDVEQRSLRRHEAAVAESWLLTETLRSREYCGVHMISAHTHKQRQHDTRTERLRRLQALLNTGRDFPEEQKMRLACEAAAAAQAAAADEEDAKHWQGLMNEAVPWQLERIRHSDAARLNPAEMPEVIPPPAFVEAMAGEQLTLAMQRATSAATGMAHHIAEQDGGQRLLVDKAIETMVEEAVHLERMRQRCYARQEVAEIRAAHAEHMKLQTQKPLTVNDETRGVIGSDTVGEVLAGVWQRLSVAASCNTEESFATWPALLNDAQREVQRVVAEEKIRSIAQARQEWERTHEREMVQQKEKMHIMLHQSLEEAREKVQEGSVEQTAQAVASALAKADTAHRVSLSKAVAEAVARTQEEEAEKKAIAVQEAVKAATAKAMNARVMQAETAALDFARKQAFEEARLRMNEDVKQLTERCKAAEERERQALDQVDEVKKGTSKAALQAVALAAPVQRQAVEAAVKAAAHSERQKAEIQKQVELEVAVSRVRADAERSQSEAVQNAVSEARAAVIKETKVAIESATEMAKMEERKHQQAIARAQMREALNEAAEAAAEERRQAVKEALQAEARRLSASVTADAVKAVEDQSAAHARSMQEQSFEHLKRELALAEIRHQRLQKQAISAAVEEVVAQRKIHEEKAIQGAVNSAVNEARRDASTTLAREVSEAERRGMKAEAERSGEKVRAAVEEAVAHTMNRIKPALQRQDGVEQAIRNAEERARQHERTRATEIQARIEELAADAAQQPKAVQAQVRAAVQAAEDRFDKQLAAVHETYKKAAAEQQQQIKELLRQAHEHARQQQETAIRLEAERVRKLCDEEKETALGAARAAVQMSALQQAEQLDSVMNQIAELRAENKTQEALLQERASQLERARKANRDESTDFVVRRPLPSQRSRQQESIDEDDLTIVDTQTVVGSTAPTVLMAD
eukprot:CAMPEP_0119299652 /NCGR_PEP_ID=MMETSP1333-20130426/1697_1 /TAXON_ID=418940 /ORGANISM="Scyphosphaera apsteinii, Strain RCC1455" /LENGTH=1309 /DNA_ID=CAMNT_0007301147 /DNA_START=54 /DNA_END=3983 /DNA_ORIENTATION=-